MEWVPKMRNRGVKGAIEVRVDLAADGALLKVCVFL